ncbi:CRISPR-associated endonuclease Cas2 [Ancylobacter sp. WKF20]|uniref:CRISPR-associated endonuclease Cas2 n=1 Tax=Ancylobacter sp. WKF20 TaxID=3039801 RepID=UPI00243431D3|nr:CRISPR-associated endonuclease Cas2 [Ancylobacter sp. WKF20]WGD28405.1 CRISPR-associated endonuclease Cas2 [Ancylobacter sp. WKF20]
MAAKVLAVVCYDVIKDSVRDRLASLLEEELIRVQESVFEGWIGEGKLRNLVRRSAALIGPDDSLRVYRLGASDAMRTIVHGPTPAVEAGDYYLF